jgi:hypothetical protein
MAYLAAAGLTPTRGPTSGASTSDRRVTGLPPRGRVRHQ